MTSAADWKELAAQAQPPRKTVRLCLRGDLQADLDAALAAVEPAAASLAGPPPDSDDIRQLREQVQAATVEFQLIGLTRQRLRTLEAAHSDPDGGGWNMDTFPEALVRACLRRPEIAADEPLFDLLTAGQAGILFETAYKTCSEVDDVPLPKRG